MYGNWTIRGQRADGSSTVGRWEADSDIEATIRNRYDSGWRTATLTLDGVEVGWIADNPDGERVWWCTDRRDQTKETSHEQTHAKPDTEP